MIPNVYEEDLACASSPFRFTWPRELQHGPSPLTRQERPSSSSHSIPAPSPKLPPFSDVFEAAAEPPPPYTELPRVPFASCYALAYDRPLNFQHHVVPVPIGESTEDLEMSIDDELRYLGQLTIDMSDDFGEVETPSPTSTSFDRSAPSSSSSIGPWRAPRQRHRRFLLRRKPNAAGQRALACLRMNFILQNVPQLAVGLSHFEDRAATPVAEVFYSWYDQLSADQRVRYMPWFVPERLDLVRTGPSSGQGKPAAQATTANEKTSSKGQAVPSQSKAAAMAAAAQESMKRKAARSTSPPPSCTSLPGWEDLDQAVRLLQVLPNRQACKDFRKEATIRAWKTSVAQLGWSQWYLPLLFMNQSF